MRPSLWAGALLAAFAAGWMTNGWRNDATRAHEFQAAAETVRLANAARDVVADHLRASDDLHAAELQKAQDETNSLRDRVSAGPVRLRVAAKFPNVPSVAAGPGVGAGTGAELDPSARSAYFALRDGIDRAEAKLAACQAELKLR